MCHKCAGQSNSFLAGGLFHKKSLLWLKLITCCSNSHLTILNMKQHWKKRSVAEQFMALNGQEKGNADVLNTVSKKSQRSCQSAWRICIHCSRSIAHIRQNGSHVGRVDRCEPQISTRHLHENERSYQRRQDEILQTTWSSLWWMLPLYGLGRNNSSIHRIFGICACK